MSKNTSQKQIVSLAKKLMSVPSVAENIKAQEDTLKKLVEVFGDDFIVKEYRFNNNPALVLSTSQKKKVDLIVSGHMDVVPGDNSLFKPKEKGTKLFGRGSYDMKAALVSSIYAVRDYKKNGGLKDIAILITADEEVSGYGTNMLLTKEKYKADFTFIPDGGSDTGIVLRQKGFIQIKVTITGKSVHASEPWKGEDLFDILDTLKQTLGKVFPGPTANKQWKTSVVMTKVESKNSLNQIPGEIEIYFDIRYTKPDHVKKILNIIKKHVGKKGEIQTIEENGMFSSDKNNHYIKILSQSIEQQLGKRVYFVNENGTSDAIFFAEHGIQVALYRPVGGGAHQNDEWVSTKSLHDLYLILRNFLERC